MPIIFTVVVALTVLCQLAIIVTVLTLIVLHRRRLLHLLFAHATPATKAAWVVAAVSWGLAVIVTEGLFVLGGLLWAAGAMPN